MHAGARHRRRIPGSRTRARISPVAPNRVQHGRAEPEVDRRHGVTVTVGLIAAHDGPRCPAQRQTSSSAGAAPVAHTALSTALQWQQIVPDAGNPIAQSSPTEATLDGDGPSVVVGDRAGNVWGFHLSDGSTTPGWPAHTGAPVDATPSVLANGSGTDNVFVDAGNAAQPTVGGYYAFSNTGAANLARWGTGPQRPARRAGLSGGRRPERGIRRRGAVAGPEPVRARTRRTGPRCRAGRSSPRTAASPPRPWPTCTATARPRSSRAATRRPAWPMA